MGLRGRGGWLGLVLMELTVIGIIWSIQNSITPKSSTPSNHKCTCGMEPMSSVSIFIPFSFSFSLSFRESLIIELSLLPQWTSMNLFLPNWMQPVSDLWALSFNHSFFLSAPSPSSSFSFFSRKKSTPTSESGRGRFFQARKTRQLPPTGRVSSLPYYWEKNWRLAWRSSVQHLVKIFVS